jgi:hypothetical protein
VQRELGSADIDATTHDMEEAKKLALEAAKNPQEGFWFQLEGESPLSEFGNIAGKRFTFRAGLGDKPQKIEKEAVITLDLIPIPSEAPIMTQSESILGLSPLNWQIC